MLTPAKMMRDITNVKLNLQGWLLLPLISSVSRFISSIVLANISIPSLHALIRHSTFSLYAQWVSVASLASLEMSWAQCKASLFQFTCYAQLRTLVVNCHLSEPAAFVILCMPKVFVKCDFASISPIFCFMLPKTFVHERTKQFVQSYQRSRHSFVHQYHYKSFKLALNLV